MTSVRHKVFAAFALYLLFCASPLDAKRVISTQGAVRETIKVRGLSGEKDNAQFWTSCSRLQSRFQSRSEAGSSNAQLIREANGTAGFTAVSSTLFSMWSMVRIVRRAQARECEWVADVDVGPLQEVMQATLADNPCLPVVEARLRESEDADEETQAQVFLSSMGMLMTNECNEQPMTEEPADTTGLDEPVDDTDTELVVEELVEDLQQVNAAGDDESIAAALIQLGGNQPSHVAEASMRFWPPPFWSGVDRWLIHTPDVVVGGNTIIEGSTTALQSAGPQTAQEWVMHGLGVAAWLIGFALVCTTAVYLLALILGALLCLLRSILLVLLMRTTSMRTCLNRMMDRVASYQTSAGFVGGLCLAGGAGLITTHGGVVGVTNLR